MKRPGWVREKTLPIWTREVSAIEVDGGAELRVRRHAPKRFSWSADCDMLPATGRTEISEVNGYAGSLDDAQEQAERAVRFLGRRVE